MDKTTSSSSSYLPAPSNIDFGSSTSDAVVSTTNRSISWITERDMLRQFGDRRTRAILAIVTSRRSARTCKFFVPPHIAELYRLTSRDLCWAFKQLEGEILDTVESTKGRFRRIRLLPGWEGLVQAERKKPSPPIRQENAIPLESTGAGTEGVRAATEAEPGGGCGVRMDSEIEETLDDIARQQAVERSRGGLGPVPTHKKPTIRRKTQ